LDLGLDVQKVALKVNEYLNSLIDGYPKLLYDASSHLIKTGGKRLRPFLVIKSCELFGGDPSRAIPAAAAIELVHNFSLVHDDIMDNDHIRHGVPTVHVKYGMPTAIVAGDLLFAKAFETINKIGDRGVNDSIVNKATYLLAESSINICEGQALDYEMASKTNFHSTNSYIKMINKKTAVLFGTSCRIGSLIGGANLEQEKSIELFGRLLGIAFQLVDDVLGIGGDAKVTGKPVGGDIREGKKTYVISEALRLSKEDDKKNILTVFGKSNVSQEGIEKALASISKTGAAEIVRKQAESYAKKALEVLGRFPDNSVRKSLDELLNFIVSRNI
jgi:geranylgeranyl diphosphate synthase type I